MKLKKIIQLAVIVSLIVALIYLAFLWLTPTETTLIPSAQISNQSVEQTAQPALVPPINASIEKNSAQQQTCRITIQPKALNEAWHLLTRERIEQYLLSIAKQAVTKATMGALMIQSGINPKFGFRQIRIRSGFATTRLLEKTPTVTVAEDKLFHQLAADKDLNGYIAAYQQHRLPTEKQFLIGHVFYTPFELLFELSKKTSIDVDQTELLTSVSQLLQAGVIVRLNDLVIATASGFSVQVLAMLNNASSFNADTSFWYDRNYHTLVTLALAKNHIDAAQFWVNENIHGEPIPFRNNVLDMIATMGATAKPDQYTSLLPSLFDSGLTANNPASLDHFSSWLDTELLQKYQSQLNHFSVKQLTDEQHAFIAKSRTAMAKLVLDGPLSISEINHLTEHNRSCLLDESSKLIWRVFKNAKPISRTTGNRPDNEPKRLTLAELEAQQLTKDEIFEALGKYKDLDSKKTVSDYKTALYKRELTEKAKEPKPAEKQQASDTVKKMIADGDWQQAIEQHVAEHDKQLDEQLKLNLSFMMALNAGATTDELLALVAQGAEVAPEFMMTLIYKGNVALLRGLYQNGFNIHYVFPSGQNAVSLAVQLKKLSMLSFFVEHGVSVKPLPYGFDPLDEAIKNLSNDSFNFGYVKLLINAGAPIEHSHKQAVQKYMQVNHNLYSRLVIKFPLLKI
ncbi:MAG: hypothetical protein MJK04_16710 [Psychrosphaera sp.]|nr:hypothetical protein [Psychrosphaera sp.]